MAAKQNQFLQSPKGIGTSVVINNWLKRLIHSESSVTLNVLGVTNNVVKNLLFSNFCLRAVRAEDHTEMAWAPEFSAVMLRLCSCID